MRDTCIVNSIHYTKPPFVVAPFYVRVLYMLGNFAPSTPNSLPKGQHKGIQSLLGNQNQAGVEAQHANPFKIWAAYYEMHAYIEITIDY